MTAETHAPELPGYNCHESRAGDGEHPGPDDVARQAPGHARPGLSRAHPDDPAGASRHGRAHADLLQIAREQLLCGDQTDEAP